MRSFTLIVVVFFCISGLNCPILTYAQTYFPAGLQFSSNVLPNILGGRSVTIFQPTYTQAELEQIQKSFQQIGIDAEAYFPDDLIFSGREVTSAYSAYFNTRQIQFIITLLKSAAGYELVAAPYSQSVAIYDVSKPAWQVKNSNLTEMLRTVFQDSWNNQKKQNFLVNDYPEMDIRVNPFKGVRYELYAIDLKVDQLAVPKFGQPEMDQQLEAFMKENYPLKYVLTNPGTDDQRLRSDGSLYVLCFVRTRGSVAREVLGYDMTKAETAYASITYPAGQLQLKTLPSGAPVYKFYFRHLVNGNIYLGPKWDADENWLDALRNHITGFKAEVKLR